MNHFWALGQEQTERSGKYLEGVSTQLPYLHCTWTSEIRADIVSHSWNEGRSLCVLQKQDGFWQDEVWFMRATQYRRITQPRCYTSQSKRDTQTICRFNYLIKLDHVSLLNPFCRYRSCLTFLPTRTNRRNNLRGLSAWMPPLKWSSLNLMKMSLQICWGAVLLFTSFLWNTYKVILQGYWGKRGERRWEFKVFCNDQWLRNKAVKAQWRGKRQQWHRRQKVERIGRQKES